MKVYFFMVFVVLMGPQIINADAATPAPCNGETTPTTCATTKATISCTSTPPPCTGTPTPKPTTPCEETSAPTKQPPCTESITTPPCTASPITTGTTTCTTTTCTTTTCTTTTKCSTTTVACTTLTSGGNLVDKPLQYLSSTKDCATLPDGTILLDFNHCRRYYICQNHRAKRTRCAVGSWFDPTERQCLPRGEVTNCIAGRS